MLIEEQATPTNAHATAEFAACSSYGRLLAYLVARWKDVAAAEDALSEAFLQAVRTWPERGTPDNPEAWILTVARRKLTDAQRKLKPTITIDEIAILANEVDADKDFLPEHRLALMLLCAHPSIEVRVRAPLMLQTVLGVDVPTMSAAFLISPSALTRRLTRAKQKISQAGIGFHLPNREVLPSRLWEVLEAIYTAYFLGASTSELDGDRPNDLSQEALYLADLIVSLQPESAEAAGLLAVLSFCEGRRPAQTRSPKIYVALAEQDCASWDTRWINAGHALMMRAHALGAPGPFQTEAAIQAAHCSLLFTGFTPWTEIANLYEILAMQTPTLQVKVGRAVAQFHATSDATQALLLLAECGDLAVGYMPWWLARAHLFHQLGQTGDAELALRRAVGLTKLPRTRKALTTLSAAWSA